MTEEPNTGSDNLQPDQIVEPDTSPQTEIERLKDFKPSPELISEIKQDPQADIEPAAEPNTEPDIEPERINNRPNAASNYTLPPIGQTEPETPADTVSSDINTSGNIVLQWLTYAFWGWTVIAVSILSAVVLTFFLVKDTPVGDFALYSMAAALVLLPVAVICDVLYIKREPIQKHGAKMALTVIHAVVFALFGIGSVITVVFSIVGLATTSAGTEQIQVTLYSGLIIAALFAVLFVRTILPATLAKLRYPFVVLMAVIVGIICAFGFFGPVMDAQLTRNDKLIEGSIDSLGSSIDEYVVKNSQLPNDLGSLTLKGDTKKLATSNLVTYKKDTKPSTESYGDKVFYYQLCTKYKKASAYQSSSSSSYSKYSNDDEYSSYISAYSHPAGDVCYKVQASSYSYSYPIPGGTDD